MIHAMDAFAGAVGVSDSDGKCSPVYSVCAPIDQAAPRYYARVVREMALNGFIQAQAKGIRERSTDFRFQGFSQAILPFPPLDEQRAIANFLDAMDTRITRFIAARKKMMRLLEEKKQAVINQAVTKGLDPTVAMKDSDVDWLGEIPAHWEVRRLKTLLTRNDSGAWGSEYAEDGTPVLRSTEQTQDGGWRIDSPARRELSAHERDKTLLKEGDLVVTTSSGSQKHIGKTSIVTEEMEEVGYGFSNFMQRLRTSPALMPRLAWYLINNQIGRQQLIYLSSTTTGLANLNGTILGQIVTPAPPTDEQEAIIAYLDVEAEQLNGVISKAMLEIELMQEYRTRLISDVVTGKLDVRGIDLGELPPFDEIPDPDELTVSDNVDIAITEEATEEVMA